MQYRLMALQYGSGDELPNDGTPKTEQWVLPQLPDPSYPPTNLHLPSLSRPKPSPENLAGLANGGCIMRDDMGIVLHWGYTQLDGGDCKVLMDQLQVVVNDMCILILTSNIKWLA
ncbi:hypothetical protein F2Q68_00010130 [Brassica cretica]|uniref:Uncharacterized protein n=1 Tax=Brassica cretica TaxID=69181 RepID=A0A8S9KRV3_BRACR|nr:hypothetical protein F2Q68_00010130 [Brassica cretica]